MALTLEDLQRYAAIEAQQKEDAAYQQRIASLGTGSIPEYPRYNSGIKKPFVASPPTSSGDNSSVYKKQTFGEQQGIVEGTGGVSTPTGPDAFTGIFSTPSYNTPVDDGFGSAQENRTEYFGPTNWNPGIGNDYYSAVAATAGTPVLNAKDIRKQVKKYSGPRTQWTPGTGNAQHQPSQPNIIQAVTESAPSNIFSGHPSAGDTSEFTDTSSGSLEDLMFEQFGESTVYPTNDTYLTAPTFGKYFGSAEQPFVSSNGEAALDLPYGDPVFTSSGYKDPLQADQGLINATNGLVLEGDDYRVSNNQGTFEDFIHGGPSIADAGLSLTDEGLAGLNQTAIGLMTNPNRVPSYAASLDRYNGHPSAGVTYPQSPQYDPNRESLTYKGSAPQNVYDLAQSSGQEAIAANEAALQEMANTAAMEDEQGSVFSWPRKESKFIPTVMGSFPYPNQ